MALDFAAGCVGGCAGVLVGHPLDTIKVHLQTQDSKRSIYRGTWHCLQTIVAKDSIRGLYRGISSPLGGVAFVNAIVFGVYGNVQRNTKDPDSLGSHFIAGSTAGLVQSLVCSPMELAKTYLQLQDNFKSSVKHKGPLSCLYHIYGKDGFRGLFRGLGITALRDVPGFAGYFVSYELLMRQVAAPSAFHCLIAGGLAGTFSWMLTFPIDVVKSCLQADGMMTRPKYTGILDCIQKGYQSEGIHFFSRGLTSTLLRAFPMNAACFFVVSLVMRLSQNNQLPIELYQPESLAIVSASDSVPIKQSETTSVPINSQSEDIQKKDSRLVKTLVFLGSFSEAIFEAELEELANELCSDEKKDYYLLDSNRLEDVIKT
ncbi:mitochondrial basic amino acids transporter [Episyrphus balteatus]|uniref:mitochondrial basic amino acids transporter n=1 Tax=Episyrphus balteatus TaxID=286459 RepID=UPI00248590D8|nr:mitochondrial basic amino acids transporter [Episyrphus balteatus]